MAVDQLRMILILTLGVLGFLLWDAWERDYGPSAGAGGVQPAQTSPSGGVAGVPDTESDIPSAPPVLPSAQGDIPSAAGEISAIPSTDETAAAPTIRVITDVLSVEIDTRGGTIDHLELTGYPVAVDRPDEAYRLLDDRDPNRYFTVRSGMARAQGADPNQRLPTSNTVFEADRTLYELPVGDQSLEVPLRWRSADGVEYLRTYRFERNAYTVEMRTTVTNAGKGPWKAALYAQMQRSPPSGGGGLFGTYTYTGGVLSGPEDPYEKVDFSDMERDDLERDVAGGWAAMIEHYFTVALVPGAQDTNRYYSRQLAGGKFALGVVGPSRSVDPGQSEDFSLTLYAGPKIQDRMESVAENLNLTVDYGFLSLIAEPLFWLLRWIHTYIGNWGFSIIVLTCLIKLAFFHLSATSYRSMARMRKLQPRITALRDRYSSDRQRMNQEMMNLYREEKINPLGGCLPILVQIPVFIALYWVLLESVELRQAPFIGWLVDLSEHDPYFVLPILMGLTMLIQQRLNPSPPDPIQAKIMMALPFVFTFFFLFFPSGLVLYWFVNNVLSIIQQWVITKKIVGTT